MRELILFKEKPEILRQVSREVTEFGSALDHVIDDLTYVMRSCERSVGIAAIQAGDPTRLSLLELNYQQETLSKPTVLINPEVITHGGLVMAKEGCLSLPGMQVQKRRPDLLKVRYQDINGKRHEEIFRGLWARCVAHEIDHMNGKLIIDK